MKRMMESFWRALLDSFRPRVIALSLLPLGLIIVAALLLGYFYWNSAVATTAAWMEASTAWTWVSGRLLALGLENATAWLAPLLVVLAITPVLVIVTLLLVTMFMTPMMANGVAQRRFAELERRGGQSFWRSLAWSLFSTAAAVVALVATLPLWLIPPLAVILPPLIWGWLAYRVLSFDSLQQHASTAERKLILEQHRWPLLVIGVVCGFLGAVPSVVWASGVLFAVAFVVLVPIAIWLFTWVFAFTSLWYAHYCLEVLEGLRGPVPKSVSKSAPTAVPPPEPAAPATQHAAASAQRGSVGKEVIILSHSGAVAAVGTVAQSDEAKSRSAPLALPAPDGRPETASATQVDADVAATHSAGAVKALDTAAHAQPVAELGGKEGTAAQTAIEAAADGSCGDGAAATDAACAAPGASSIPPSDTDRRA